MNILLINKNMVVSKLVKLSAKELGALLDEQTSLEPTAQTHYDVAIIDESAFTPQLESALEQLRIGSTLLLSNSPMELMQRYDFELKKPFLPHDLSSILLEITTPKQKTQPLQTVHNNDEVLLEQLLTLEPSKIKKILAGTKVTITIEFPKESMQ